MANVSQFVAQQFVDAGSLTTFATNVSSAITNLVSGIYQGGLVAPTVISFGSSGLIASITLPPPFQIIFGNGVSSFAHGTLNGQDTQTYSTNLTSLVPVSGSTTAYILASYAQIFQNQNAIVGPPPGHPDFNPNFQPYLAYSAGVDSIAVTSSLSGADNLTTFELARVTLAAGATGINKFITVYQERAAERYHLPNTPLVGFNITNTADGKLITLPNSGLYTLPTLSSASTQTFFFTTQATGGLTLIQASVSDPFGSNLIYGTTQNPIFGAPVIQLLPGGAVWLGAANGFWQVLNGTPYARGTMFRPLQISATNYYINAQAGSNSNNGLSPSSAWQTLQYGHDFVHNNIDLGGYQAIFNCVGNFTTGLESCGPWIGMTEAYNALFQFATGSTVITSGTSCFLVHTFSGLQINGPVTLSSTVSGNNPLAGYAIIAEKFGRVILGPGNINYSTCALGHLFAGSGGIIVFTDGYTISGGAPYHYQCAGSAEILASQYQSDTPFPPPAFPFTVTLTGTPTFSIAFIGTFNTGNIDIEAGQVVFSGSASGTRYTGSGNAVISTAGGGPTFFPGTSASGTLSTGAQYS